ncbi:hypothetical protein BURPS668_A1367 [Burkholderia pseudomallei 668]|nr:hypothetical protein BURPS668_A1367 [Burkholderia pseudomallei 668]
MQWSWWIAVRHRCYTARILAPALRARGLPPIAATPPARRARQIQDRQ